MKLSALVIVPFVLFIAASLVNQSITGEDLATGEKKGLTAKEWGESEFSRIATNEEVNINQVFNSHKCKGEALCLSESVLKVVEGDTIQTSNYVIRLSLADTPEKDEEGFSEAIEFTEIMCPEKSFIIIDQDDKQKTDFDGRMLANVFCDGKSLNSALLRNGHAEISSRYCEFSEFSDTIWAQNNGCKIKVESTS